MPHLDTGPSFKEMKTRNLRAGERVFLNVMKEGLLGGTLCVSSKSDRKGGPLQCCTLVWI